MVDGALNPSWLYVRDREYFWIRVLVMQGARFAGCPYPLKISRLPAAKTLLMAGLVNAGGTLLLGRGRGRACGFECAPLPFCSDGFGLAGP